MRPEYTLEQQAANRETWCKALESDSYKQGRAYLCHVSSREHASDPEQQRHCCLGVACEEAMEAGVPLKKFFKEAPDTGAKVAYFHGSYDGHSWYSTLPIDVQCWLGLKASDAFCHSGVSLAIYNDMRGEDFKAIAARIRNGDVQVVGEPQKSV